MKRILPGLCILIAGTCCFAQKNIPRQVSIESRYVEADKHFLSEIGLDLNMPTGNWRDQYGVGVGANYTIDMIASKNVSIVGEVNYSYIFGKVDNSGIDIRYDPIHRIQLMVGPRLVSGTNNIRLSVEFGGALSFFNSTSEGGFCWRMALSKLFPAKKTPVFGMELGYGSFQYADKARSEIELRALLVLAKPTIFNHRED